MTATPPRPTGTMALNPHEVGRAPASSAAADWDPAGARVARLSADVARLPALPPDDGSRYSIRRLTVAWLLETESPKTEQAYQRDLSVYLQWCETERLDPLSARPTDVGQFRVWRSLRGRAGRAAAPSTVARALAAVSSWYTYLVVNTDGRITRNPLDGVKRPKVPNESATVGLTLDEVDALLAAADARAADRAARWRANPSPTLLARYLAAMRDRALLHVLADLGLRIDEALARDVDDLSYNASHRTLRFVGKGGRPRERPMPPDTGAAVDDYLQARAAAAGLSVNRLAGPLFATGTAGTGRLAAPNVFLLIRRLAAKAGIPSAARLSPHSLRHASATAAKQYGVALEDVQDAMGHADPRTTRRYDRDRENLDRDPAYVLASGRATRRAAKRNEPAAGAPIS
ncbi:Site-specific recombinase XerD [Asanoa hainanensis]|uniref:Site-specific recombinase XerD n=1 Tax=Asanoa hainanensis TaxID=560556 RepID=A0A239PH02_9ACTN|nr:tyrosine-type recombinase/integrase [Asanoa hainanensis]SNT65868.1 Site-specific recombinase XerD [Asanoa hainanensis]